MDRIITLLESIQKRPGMYIGNNSFENVRTFISGMSSGLIAVDLGYTDIEYIEAAKSLGWNSLGNIGIKRDFIKKELSEEEMINALIEVEIAAYKLAQERMSHGL